MSSNEISIKVEDITKSFNVIKPSGVSGTVKKIMYNEQKRLIALQNISFSVKKGEMVGIIGLNGSGKTTLLRTIAGIYTPDKGKITTHGILAPLLQIGTGFHEELTARDNIIMYGMLLGFSKKAIIIKIEKIIQFAELEEFANMKLKQYSTGMKARLAFSTALQIDPDILLVDEILAVGDIAFKQKSFEEFLSFKKKKKTILYSSHSIGMMPELCDRILLMDHAKMIMLDEPNAVLEKYKEIVSAK